MRHEDKAILIGQIPVKVSERAHQDRVAGKQRRQIPQEKKTFLVRMADGLDDFQRVGLRRIAVQAQRGTPDLYWPVVAIVGPGQVFELALQALFFTALEVDQRVVVKQALGQAWVQSIVHGEACLL